MFFVLYNLILIGLNIEGNLLVDVNIKFRVIVFVSFLGLCLSFLDLFVDIFYVC